jgi:DNA-binding NarL/FixJ family response regulator
LDHFREAEARFSRGAGDRSIDPIRRHLAIVDQSPLRGAGFEVILLGGSTSAHIDLADLALLSAAAPETPILVTAECDDAEAARATLRSGARGFLPTSLGLKVLMGALERMRAGGTYVPLLLSEPVSSGAADRARHSPWPELTRRQRDVLALISEGMSNKLIGDTLTMTESTVKAHVKQIIRRLHVANRTQAALLATRASLPSARH